ncbi:hypothetical protein [Brevibacterium sp. NPDC056947]|uniref:hypothetical protein n=1 Tax=Brevibacterium sp. NPDC056947 TaxID=3345974 RepID=UPI003641E521
MPVDVEVPVGSEGSLTSAQLSAEVVRRSLAEVVRQIVDLAGPMPPRDRPPRRSGTEPSEEP